MLIVESSFCKLFASCASLCEQRPNKSGPAARIPRTLHAPSNQMDPWAGATPTFTALDEARCEVPS
jgi:hypothetical protein